MTEPEFSHLVKLSDLGDGIRDGKLSASEPERAALAKRFDLPGIAAIDASFQLFPGDRGISFSGTLRARLQQNCAITGEPFDVKIEEPFEILFCQEADKITADEEVELSADDCDIVEYSGGHFDLGEALAQTLYLALDPYPRGPGADDPDARKKLTSEEEAGPFGVLASLKDKLG